MSFQVRIVVQVVNEHGDVMNTRGHPSFLNKDGRLEANRTLTHRFTDISDAHNALNLVWGFVAPVDNILSRNRT